MRYGFVRVATAVPVLQLANPRANAMRTLEMLQRCALEEVDVVVFPEMGLTGYTCNDLFFQKSLQEGAVEALRAVVLASARVFAGVAVVGLPLVVDDQVFNCAAVVHRGEVLGVIPKTYLPTYKEFYDARYFAPASTAYSRSVMLFERAVPFGIDLLFPAVNLDELTIGVEICEDLWGPVPPSSLQAFHGATLLLNLSASNETIAKAQYRRDLVKQQSARCLAAYAYCSCGVGESTTDIVFGGHCLIAENGILLAESQRFQRADELLIADLDLERMRVNRQLTTSFNDAVLDLGMRRDYRRIPVLLPERTQPFVLRRVVEPNPFVPSVEAELEDHCQEIFSIQVNGLARRLDLLGNAPVSIGVSGGLDSTLALLVLCKTLDRLGTPLDRVRAITMPGFGTSGRTLTNAKALMDSLGISYQEIDIRGLCLAEMKALGHQPFGINLEALDVDGFTALLRDLPPDRRTDLGFENVQARCRTSLLMNTAFVIGTGDLSELALGWCTYNADHMSMYNPNVSIPKTLVKFLVKWVAEHEFSGPTRATLLDIVATEISPELLPMSRSGKPQSTESSIGPYELQDFFLYYFLRYGMSPAKIQYLASQTTFEKPYTPDEIQRWLRVFITRFFRNQFKRSCLPDGPKVGSVSLSPRGDWRMPSDAQANQWLDAVGD